MAKKPTTGKPRAPAGAAGAADDEGVVSLTGKHLPSASQAGSTLSRAALELLGRAIPDEFVREVVTHSAPMARLGGRSNAGAAALSQALKLLSQPPAARAPLKDEMTLEEIGKRIGRSRSVVAAWADGGLLGKPVSTTRGRKWGREGLERARLVDYLLRHGISREEVAEAARTNQLPLLVLSQTLAGKTTLTRRQMARQSGVPVEMVDRITRALGVASGHEDEALYSQREVYAIRLIGSLRSVYSDDDLVEVASVVGRAIHEIAEATLELFRRRFAKPFAEAGASELEMMLRLATVIDLTVPTTGPMLELVLRRQLEVTSRSEAVVQLERTRTSLDGQVEQAVGFADIVGFTEASTRMNALEVSQLAARLLRTAEEVFPRRGARLVKTIGDAVMFTAPDALSAAVAAGDLVRMWKSTEGPDLRVGIAQGPMLRAYADYFGRTVNVASRLSDAAPAGMIYLLKPEQVIRADSWKARRLLARDAGEKTLKGIDGRVRVVELKPI
ncbi:MAG: adenylate/guanylate cyclase domain-containing protein [Candidatus Dormibacteraeota bacterium]|nr:adenylate/guanylate cyclase domain-containing protein [Candidatus Dormibacteraeota bacterium]